MKTKSSTEQAGGVDLETIARHEAAHAVMRALLGLPCGYIIATPEEGFNSGSGRKISPKQEILIALAGFAWEALASSLGKPLPEVSWDTSRSDDVDAARDVLRRAPSIVPLLQLKEGSPELVPMSINQALDFWFKCAAQLLKEQFGLIENIGSKAEESGRLSERQVEAIIRTSIKGYRAKGAPA